MQPPSAKHLSLLLIGLCWSATGIPGAAQDCVSLPTAAISWWPGEANAADVLGAHDAVPAGGAAYAAGVVGQAFALDGVDDVFVVADSPALDPPTDAITIEAWIRADGSPAGLGGIVTKYATDEKAWAFSRRGDGGLRWAIYDEAGGTSRAVDTAAGAVPIGTFHHVAATFDVATQALHVYLDGAEIPSSLLSCCSGLVAAMGDTAADVEIGNLGGTASYFQGIIDEPVVYDRVLAPAEILAIHDAGSGGKCLQEYPGSGEDFRLLTGVDAPPSSVGVKSIAGGSTLKLRVDSPGGGYIGASTILFTQVFLTGSPPGGTPGDPLFADFQLNFFTPPPLEVVTGLWNVPALSPAGNEISAVMPSYGAAGVSLMLQAIAIHPAAPNGLFVTSDAHELRLLPQRIYVDGVNGNDTQGGTKGAPLETIAEALERASSLGLNGAYPEVLVASGSYSEDLHLTLPITMRGGYDAANWTKVSGQYSSVGVSNRGFRVRDIQTATTISGFDFQASDGIAPPAGGPFDMDMASVSLDVRTSNSNLAFEDCVFQAGTGATGAAGAAGADGSLGENGSFGGPGFVTLVEYNGHPGGAGGYPGGGAGGHAGDFYFCWPWMGCIQPGLYPVEGLQGSNGTGPAGGCPGGAGSSTGALDCVVAGFGQDAPQFTEGAPHGNQGTPAASPGGTVLPSGDWRPDSSAAGQPGQLGCGGGGGGGGGAARCNSLFFNGASGGGGGGGGFPGAGGGAAVEGGASFAVYLFDASPAFTGCRFFAGLGGTGGEGGDGGLGGFGGAGLQGGLGLNQVIDIGGTPVGIGSGDGGRGADGQRGGGGGGAGGAHGGPSWCVFKAGASNPVGLLSDPTNFLSPGQGGIGGFGGAQGITNILAPSGLSGPSGAIGS